MIRLEDITKSYGLDRVVLNNMSLHVRPGEFLQIIGSSGAGKSTLLNVLGLLDRKFTGKYLLGGQDVGRLSDSKQSLVRAEKIGFVFQAYNLISGLSARENIMLPTLYARREKTILRRRLERLLWQFDIEEIAQKPVQLLSGGEKQRVAIARALILDPSLILADEPTGNLDASNSDIVFNTLSQLKKRGKTIVMVTHNTYVDSGADRVIKLKNGGLYERMV